MKPVRFLFLWKWNDRGSNSIGHETIPNHRGSYGNGTPFVPFPWEIPMEMERPEFNFHRKWRSAVGGSISIGNETTAAPFPIEMERPGFQFHRKWRSAIGGSICIGNETTAVSFPMEIEQVEMETPTALLHPGCFISVGNETTAVSSPLEMVHFHGE